MKNSLFVIFLFGLWSCYNAPKIDQFDSEDWLASMEECDSYRKVKSKEILIGSSSPILTINQNELQELLGTPDQHQLFNRNQKFFFYNLDCDSTARLSVRFDALGRVKEVTIEKTQ